MEKAGWRPSAEWMSRMAEVTNIRMKTEIRMKGTGSMKMLTTQRMPAACGCPHRPIAGPEATTEGVNDSREMLSEGQGED